MTPDQLQKIEEAAEKFVADVFELCTKEARDNCNTSALMAAYRAGAQWASAQHAKQEEALRLIATGPRPDGTYNYDRRACQAIALAAITNHESQTAIRREPIGEDLED